MVLLNVFWSFAVCQRQPSGRGLFASTETNDESQAHDNSQLINISSLLLVSCTVYPDARYYYE